MQFISKTLTARGTGRIRGLCAALALFALEPSAGHAVTDLQPFLREVVTQTRPPSTVLGLGKIHVEGLEGPVDDEIAIVQRPNGDRYVELRKARVRALIPITGAAFIASAGGDGEAAKVDQPLAESDFLAEDLQGLELSRFDIPRIVDESTQQITVAVPPKKSFYSLYVFTFDREKKVPTKVLLYHETLNNLVKMRREEDHVQVAERWLPKRIHAEQFQLRTHSEIQLDWQPAPPELDKVFQKAALDKPSPLKWR